MLSTFEPHVILLSGPPTSGKDTLTQCLHDLDPCYVMANKFKDSTSGSSNHIIISPAEFDLMIEQEELLQWHSRYGRRYGLSRKTINTALDNRQWPIVHTGKLENLLNIKGKVHNSLSILLACTPQTIHQRLAERHAGDLEEQATRFEAAREELQETAHNLSYFDIIFDNNGNDPVKAAHALNEAIIAHLVNN
ncbi:MAG: hypothetical protein AAFX04_05560 [Pseudomonadota bacterium]